MAKIPGKKAKSSTKKKDFELHELDDKRTDLVPMLQNVFFVTHKQDQYELEHSSWERLSSLKGVPFGQALALLAIFDQEPVLYDKETIMAI